MRGRGNIPNTELKSLLDHWAVQPCPNSGCWIWAAGRTAAGYALLNVGGKNVLGHRLSWSLAKGDIPPRMHVCHRCNNPYCVNPDHLFLGTHKDNMDHRDACKRNPRGEQVGSAVLKGLQVKAIRDLLGRGWGQQAIADLFGIHQMTVSDINCGKTWRDVA